MQELIGEGRQTREIGKPHFSQYLRRLKKKGGSASCMILFKEVTRQMNKGDDIMPMHQEKRCYMMMNQKVGVIVSKSEIDEVLKSGGKVLNIKMLFKRKYEIVDRVERFKKWKGRLDVVGTGEIPGIDSSFSSFSPTVAFSAVRMLVVLTVDPRFSVESYDLSGVFLGTELRDRSLYVRLPAEAGEYAGKV